jgi:RNA polymerase-binding transcription factor DksA
MNKQTARKLIEQERERVTKLRSTFEVARVEQSTERDSSNELSSLDQHPADTGTDTFERTKDFSLLAQLDAELADIDHAAHKVDEGTYGTCEVCGKPIPDERLNALPATRYCVEDQSRVERETRASATSQHGFF